MSDRYVVITDGTSVENVNHTKQIFTSLQVAKEFAESIHRYYPEYSVEVCRLESVFAIGD